jgi:hypothetical protein
MATALPAAKKARAAGAKRASVTTITHYTARFSEVEQLLNRARGLEGTRVALRTFVAEGRDINPAVTWDEIIPYSAEAPHELRPYYGMLSTPLFPDAKRGSVDC